MNETLKRCKECEKKQPVYLFATNASGKISSRICSPCKAKSTKERFEKDTAGYTAAYIQEKTSICMFCKKPMVRKGKGCYHDSCRKKKNAKTDDMVML